IRAEADGPENGNLTLIGDHERTRAPSISGRVSDRYVDAEHTVFGDRRPVGKSHYMTGSLRRSTSRDGPDRPTPDLSAGRGCHRDEVLVITAQEMDLSQIYTL